MGVVDKPLAPTSRAAGELIDRAEHRGVALTVFHNRRWDSDQLTLRRLNREGSLGDVVGYESRIERWLPRVRGKAWETTSPQEGGGVLLDLGDCIEVDQALTLFGAARHVYGEVDLRRGAVADDDAFVAIEHDSGVRSHLWVSAVAGAAGPRLRVLGTGAAFVVQGIDGQEDALQGRAATTGAKSWGAEPAERWGQLVRGEHHEQVPSENGAWPRFYEQLAEALSNKQPLPVDPGTRRAVLEVLERARRAR